MNHRATQHPIKEWLNRHAILIPFVVLALAFSLAFFLDGQNQKADEKARCEAGVDSRNAQRSIVEAVYQLATGTVQRDADSPPLTKEELKQYNAYIVRVNAFRENTYKLIKPSKGCAKYVSDDAVEPPTPPMPPMKQKKVTNG